MMGSTIADIIRINVVRNSKISIFADMYVRIFADSLLWQKVFVFACLLTNPFDIYKPFLNFIMPGGKYT